ncbi:hypothetical protein TrRE_jg6760 [Triparma retinervis]|uniref:DSBA-like thioredoxin domain-containing protein n=1 Tax=Triparma retinervis TaxID=2557542 RepID=A0A9W6ZUF9_9STRA|nr:hypothetical protein TrRE_jg6760 [Triparma retinervis]
MLRKFGTLEAFEAFKIKHDLPGRGRDVGLDKEGFVQSNLSLRVQSDTFDSHRLVQLATNLMGVGAAEEVMGILNKRHFTEGGVLNDRRMLVEAAVSAGMDGGYVVEFLGSERGVKEVWRALEMVEGMGIQSIPHLVVGGERTVGGAKGVEDIVDAVSRVVEGGGGKGRIFKVLEGIL